MALVKYNDNSISAISSAGQLATGGLVPIKTLTASSSATLSFVDGSDGVVLDSTYPIYLFKFINIHLQTDSKNFTFQADTGTNTSYNQTITSTSFTAYHYESGSSGTLSYSASGDQAQGTAFQLLNSTNEIGADADQSISGELYLFNPSSATFVKHFMANCNWCGLDNHTANTYTAGYFNTTTALTRVQFKISSGNIDAGTFKLYGIKDS